MTDRPPLFIHVGLRKSASTSLQKGLFAKLAGLNHFGMWIDQERKFPDDRIPALIRRIVHSDGVTYDRAAALEEAEELVVSRLDPACINTLSDEKLGGFWRGYADRRLVAERLKDLFGDIRIILMVREQVDHFRANYIALSGEYKPAPDRLRVRLPMTDHLEYYMRYPEIEQLSHLKIGSLAAMYAEVVGRDKVCVLLFEELRDDLPAWAARIGGFMGVSPDAVVEAMRGVREAARRQTRRMLAYRNVRARILPGLRLSRFAPAPVLDGFQRILAGGAKSQATMPPEWIERLRILYAEDNARLAEEFGLDLARWNYALPGSEKTS